MIISYDFHIHSALSPCASDDMTPCNIVAMAAVKELNAIAITDHNSIKNVQATIKLGKAMGITVVAGIEVQTAEDIHIVGLFETYEKLNSFYQKLKFPSIPNRPDIYGNQLIINENDEVVGEEKNLLHLACDMGIYEVSSLIIKMGGVAIPAHIDREANGIMSILGVVPDDLSFSALEFSPYAGDELKYQYKNHPQLINSDAHNLYDIGGGGGKIKACSNNAGSILKSILTLY